jgi:hypothetical protein|tara:strand:- start:2126 stop:2398 length:273 start_codon:yes stop_codon:yes gene_type:complete
MKTGDVVYNFYHGIRRYGVVKTVEKADDKWSYCTVKWFNDEIYQRTIEERKKLIDKKWDLDLYRVDLLQKIDLHKELSTLEDVRYYLNHL